MVRRSREKKPIPERKRCPRCGEEKLASDFGISKKLGRLKAYCRPCDNAYHREAYASNPDPIRIRERDRYRRRNYLAKLKARAERGLCYFCNAAVLPGKTRCAFHQEKALADQRQRSKKLYETSRRAVLDHYGHVCACCGETVERFLSIDHVEGGGNKHRREISEAGFGNTYLWLIRHNFPEGFQTLCMNCNWGRAKNGGVCPHKITAP